VSRRLAHPIDVLARGLALGLLLGLPLAACKPTEKLEACNVADADCQQSIYYALLRMRGDGYDPFLGVPPIRTLTVEEYEAELRGPTPAPTTPSTTPSTDEDAGVEDAPEPAPEAPLEPELPRIDPRDVALRLLRLVQPSTSTGEARVQDRINHVAAFYSSATRSVTVIDRGGLRNDRADTILLLHELVHAVQDDEIAGWDGASIDGDFAARAMVEGEAVLYENLGSLELDGLSVEEADWKSYYGNWVGRRRNSMRSAKSPYYSTGWFVYPLGGELLTQAYLRGGNAAVRNVQTQWPRQSVAFMAKHAQLAAPAAASIGCKASAPGAGFRTITRDRFGALQAYGFLTVNGIDETRAWAHTLGLVDDELALFFDGEARAVAVSWRLRFPTAQAASQVAIEMLGSQGFVVQARGQDVVVRGTSPPEMLDGWADPGTCD
jgi:hypothetical protein